MKLWVARDESGKLGLYRKKPVWIKKGARCDCSEYSSGGYLKGFIKRNKDSEIINHIFG